MLRLTPPGFGRFSQATSLNVVYGGGEANVAFSLANLGVSASHVTRFPDHDMGRAATSYFRKYGVGTESILYGGDRLGIYFVEFGAAMRSSKVVYDRANSSFSTLKPNEFDWETILADAQWFHWTGITPAISEGAAQACLQAVKTANKLGVTVSADVNYRKNLWQWGKTAQEVMPELVECCDMVVCGKGDAFDIFGITPTPRSESSFVSVSEQVMKRFPRIKKVINTKRGQINASHNTLMGRCWNGKYIESPILDIPHIVDRIGGGDAFMAGFIYGALTYQDDQKAIDFAVAASALKHTIEGDANLATVSEIEALMKGDTSGRLVR